MLRRAATVSLALLVVLSAAAVPAWAQTPKRGGLLRMPQEYGAYISTTYLGKFEKMAIGPITPFSEVDDWLYGAFHPEQPNNRSSVADAELNRMLVAQRRELDPARRREIVNEIQRYVADKAYYIYLPNPPQYVAHSPAVKGFKHHDGFSLGYKLMFTWLDK